ncbi:DUF4115 domain-containing protein [Deinococcus taeanensis]|uniref:helix-turn-helix domain-containing protein n=1 Tax=Deinococcus taeanensis TaxID=2737050 RepID=UPI001CDCED01|nr:helix-turn-helix domain-containing protein [Deinococcus taeanensis]UBV43125.1 DUF4115 domain-containing protein [Deinococcus taeanensis]
MTSFGTTLRQAREAQGLSTQDLALRTKIRGDYLRALEEGNVSALPERTFARSYLQRYARELGLDAQPLLADFDRMLPPAYASVSRPGPAGAPRRPVRRFPLLPFVGALAVLALAAGGWVILQNRAAPAAQTVEVTPVPSPSETPGPAPATAVKLSVSTVPAGAHVYLDNRDLGPAPVRSYPVQARAQAELRVEAPGRAPLRQAVDISRSRNLRVTLAVSGQGESRLADIAAPTRATPKPSGKATAATPAATSTKSPATPPAAKAGVRVSYSGPSWTRVTDAAGRVVFEGTPQPGTVKDFPAGVTIKTGNAGAVKVSVNGAAAVQLGQSGQVITRTF